MEFEQTLEDTGHGLRDRREQRGWTKKTKAANLAGISRHDITRIESGASGVSWGKVFAHGKEAPTREFHELVHSLKHAIVWTAAGVGTNRRERTHRRIFSNQHPWDTMMF
ncbi:MAG: helix-turn-helix transcriptional regulator [Actinomycetaceae bacterium]|nr:helix-turn-helix domain-containing protein [Arcanobacterium sp.]MDD7687239.1 helix-turn-helix transcriptional regulator [Actinomycetaceae bacterium]MDY5273463.1 helix-turn-helix transcriptional regulator [Arcanobacterium sp.]